MDLLTYLRNEKCTKTEADEIHRAVRELWSQSNEWTLDWNLWQKQFLEPISFEPKVNEGRRADGEKRLFLIIFFYFPADWTSLLFNKTRCVGVANSRMNTVLTGGCRCFVVVRRRCWRKVVWCVDRRESHRSMCSTRCSLASMQLWGWSQLLFCYLSHVVWCLYNSVQISQCRCDSLHCNDIAITLLSPSCLFGISILVCQNETNFLCHM